VRVDVSESYSERIAINVNVLLFVLVDSYTYQIYPFNTLVVMLRQKISFPRKQSL
jgi:hypothetical protein